MRQYEIVSQSRDVLAEFRLLISETQQDAEVHFQRLSTWNFDIKSIFVDSDYACIVCQELCEVLKVF